ncbi:hypothetical protein E1B28_008169 [Marasmius oreades]|uniref:GPR1/FUN34/yaaH family protein n=1 Tax=Marasmius oreades TaxID=181124 RepID=A0A9P7RXZ7_9AGAR|nr:uncharacterized protein E1B28_008169 [Marasmius oreades]KAG7091767.1 hypothetical protein E1B28_008169 [Marasmius oreades]
MSSAYPAGDADKAQVSETEEYSPNADPVTYARYPTKIANPGPAGLFNLGATAFILSLYFLHARGVQAPNVVVGMALFAGGLTQFIAGMWEFPRGNVFGATVFATFGSFWLSYATINIPASGIQAAFANEQEFHDALGIYLMTWFVITLFFLAVVIRRHVAFTVILVSLAIAFLLLGISEFNGNASVLKAGGVFLLIVGLTAFYIGASELFASEPRPILYLPQGVLDKV